MGLLKDIIDFQFYRSAFGGPVTQHTSIPKPIFPILYFSNIPIWAKP
jgi:hypothetical protein